VAVKRLNLPVNLVRLGKLVKSVFFTGAIIASRFLKIFYILQSSSNLVSDMFRLASAYNVRYQLSFTKALGYYY